MTARPDSTDSTELRLSTAFDDLEIADTHEHFHSEQGRVASEPDFFSLVEDSYVMSDLVSAGMPPGQARIVVDRGVSVEERWKAFEPYWLRCRFAGAGQVLRYAVRDLYGLEPSRATIEQINEAMRERNTLGVYRSILHDLARIAFWVEDDSCGGCTPVERDAEDLPTFVLARRFDRFLLYLRSSDLLQIETDTGIVVHHLSDLEDALATSFQRQLEAGMGAIKIAAAYDRELLFEESERSVAEADLQALLRDESEVPDGFRTAFRRPYRALEDYMFHALLRLVEQHRIPVQIHTGVFAGSGNRLTNSKASLLINTFLAHPNVDFDIFHLSFPFHDELMGIVRSFPNVYADFCWAYTLSPQTAERMLGEFLDAVPINKILLFGGDYKQPELTYAQSKLVRSSAARVLAAKVHGGWCNEDDALEVGRAILYDNAARLFSWPNGRREP